MAPRIPPSLKWLIDKRARLDGEIKKTRESLKNAQFLIDELKQLECDLAAIDRALGLHEIPVQLEDIMPIKSQYVRLNLPHGELTKSILLCLRLRGGGPVTTTEFASFIIARHADLEIADEMSKAELNKSVRYRLKNLCRQGLIERNHPLKGASEGVWSLAE